MDRLFTPWRYTYVTDQNARATTCVLCELAAGSPERDERDLVVHRAAHLFVVLNRFPYTNGHLMVVPHAHVPRLGDLAPEALGELARLTARAEGVLETVYRPEGLNVGLNLGRCAGAGIAEHLHVHVVPRWAGDTSFMTVTGETRVLPEDLGDTWRRLKERF